MRLPASFGPQPPVTRHHRNVTFEKCFSLKTHSEALKTGLRRHTPSMTPSPSGRNPGLSMRRKKIYDGAHQSSQGDGMREHGAEQIALLALLPDRSASYDDRLSVDHLSHYTAGRVCRSHQDRAQAQSIRCNHLQTAEQRVRPGVSAR